MTIPGWPRTVFVVVVVLVVAGIGCARRPSAVGAPSTADVAEGPSIADRDKTGTLAGTAATRAGTPVPGAAEWTWPPSSSGGSTLSDARVRRGAPSDTGSPSHVRTAATTQQRMAPGGGAGGSGGGIGSHADGREPVTEFTTITALEDVYFEFDRAALPPAAIKTLDANATWIKRNPAHLILIEGHCDDRGTNEYNVALGDRRARAAMNYLVAQGVPASRMTIVSYGEERPACGQPSEVCWARNRRAHFLVKVQ